MGTGKGGVNYNIPRNVKYNISLFKGCSESKMYFGTARRRVRIVVPRFVF